LHELGEAYASGAEHNFDFILKHVEQDYEKSVLLNHFVVWKRMCSPKAEASAALKQLFIE